MQHTELSKQQLKSKETKEKIFQAAKRILQKGGYETLSIKNICEEAGVSNGSFYHRLLGWRTNGRWINHPEKQTQIPCGWSCRCYWKFGCTWIVDFQSIFFRGWTYRITSLWGM